MKEITVNYQAVTFTVTDICERCHVSHQKIEELVDYGLVEPERESSSDLVFTESAYLRIKKALRLQQDLALDDAAVVMVLELLDELAKARGEIQDLKKQLYRSL